MITAVIEPGRSTAGAQAEFDGLLVDLGDAAGLAEGRSGRDQDKCQQQYC
jgi:hypothetical protein